MRLRRNMVLVVVVVVVLLKTVYSISKPAHNPVLKSKLLKRSTIKVEWSISKDSVTEHAS